MNANFIERLQEYMTAKGINDNQMTVAADLSIGLLGKLKKNGKGMNSANIEKILLHYTDLSPEWLLTGRGEMLKTNRTASGHTPSISSSEQDKNSKNPSYKQEECTPIARQTYIPGEGIPLIPFEAMAGALTSEQSVLEYECERYVVPAFSGADFLITVKGDSMLPTYKSGDLVACKRVPMSERFFQWNKAYVVDTNQGPLIKRIKPAGEGHLYLISDNEDYDPIHIPASAIYAVALVIGVIRLE